VSRFHDRVAIVTGASTGIGRATALAFAREGAAVACADVDAARGPDIVAEITGAGGHAIFVPTDVADDAQVAELVERTVAELGRLDFAFNNAASEGSRPPPTSARPTTGASDRREPRRVWSCMRHEIPPIARARRAIVNCSSVAGLVGFRGSRRTRVGSTACSASRRPAALEYAEAGNPGERGLPGRDRDRDDRPLHPRRRRGARAADREPSRWAEWAGPRRSPTPVVWLCSPQASFVTGHALAVDGRASSPADARSPGRDHGFEDRLVRRHREGRRRGRGREGRRTSGSCGPPGCPFPRGSS